MLNFAKQIFYQCLFEHFQKSDNLFAQVFINWSRGHQAYIFNKYLFAQLVGFFRLMPTFHQPILLMVSSGQND